MANIFDYIDWRGDLTFLQTQFNEIDNLILSRLSYFDFDGIIKENEEITLKQAYERFEKRGLENAHILQKEDIDLFPALAKSERFGNLLLTKYINKRDMKQEKQFSAITIILPNETSYISFRGTDNTLVGWKEDFNMSFMKLVPSQIDAKNYLNDISNDFKGNLIVGGHSKGGNLAVYASAFCNSSVQEKIIEVYNNDGPGFLEEIIETENYQKILGKIHTYLPQSSIIGRLLNHEEKYTVVKSTQIGIYQHDLYSWQLMGNKFVEMKEVTNESEFIDKTLKIWLQTLSIEQREKFWMVLFEILGSTNAETLSQISEKWFANSKTILLTYKNLDEESKQVINQTLKCLFNIAKENIKTGRNIKLEKREI